MRGGTRHGDAVAHSGERVAGAGAAADIRRPRAQYAGIGRMGTARAEFDDWTAAGRMGAAGRFAGDEGLEGDGGEQPGLGKLRLDDGRAQAKNRFSGEERRALGRGEQIAGEAERPEVFEEFWRRAAELREAAQVVHFFRGERESLQVFDHLRQTRYEDEIAERGQTPDGEFEGGLFLDLAGFEVSGGH